MTVRASDIGNDFRGELHENELLAKHTSLKVGGPADLLAVPRDRGDLQILTSRLATLGVPWFILGGGYNLLVRDGGFRGAAISLMHLTHLQAGPDGTITAEAGVRNIDAARLAEAHSLTGLEFLVGIPGTLGGAVRMNAGAHGGDIASVVTAVEILSGENIRQYPKNSLKFGYRSLQLAGNEIIISVNFQLAAGRSDTISETMDACLKKRQESQRVRYPNAGSFFKNPEGFAAWKLIDQAGLRGMAIGGAQVSEIHTNFLVNRGGASTADFLALAAHIKDKVYAASGVLLEEEVQIIGEG